MKFKSDIEVQAGLKDSSGALGASGQILSSTSGNVSWVTPTVNTVARDVQNEVKAGVAINKGQAVYVTGADGTNIIVGLASNATEATSSKTLGLLNATVAANGFADVVQIGRLAGLNTLGAVAGDPVWLGTGGNLIYGLVNKPYAPAHLVFIGVVTRVNVSNGEIFINVQNGFELNEIHDVDIKTTVPVNGDILGYNGTLWVNKTIAQWLGYTPANASGTTNYVSKFTGATTLGNSIIYDNGTNVGIGTASPGALLDVNGSIYSRSGSILSNNFGGYSGSDVNLTTNTSVGANLIFKTSLAERMRIDSGGNVGIGTSSPISKLHTTGTTTIGPGVFSTPGTMQLLTGGTSPINNRITYSTDGTGWKFAIGKNQSGTVTDQFVIQDNGNVAIGVTTAPEKLTIGGNGMFYNSSTNWAPNTALGIHISGSSSGAASFISTYLDTSTLQIGAGVSQKTGFIINGQTSASGSSIDFRTGGGSKMFLNSSGNLGIGTTAPGALLDVNGSIFSRSGSILSNNFGGYSGGDVNLTTNTSGGANLILKTSLSERLRIDAGGSVGIGTSTPMYTLHVNGSVAGTSAYVNLSDERYKKDILPIENALDKVLSLNGVTFNWDKGFNSRVNLDNNNHIGLIAQEVEKIIPQAVSTASDGEKTKSVAYSDLVPVLIEAIKEQQKQIEELKKLINK